MRVGTKKSAKKLVWYEYFSYICSRTKYLKNYRSPIFRLGLFRWIYTSELISGYILGYIEDI
jgi:hypothetical protein